MNDAAAMEKPKRLTSLDALRGFDMFWITGGTYFLGRLFKWTDHPFFLAIERQFHHSEWNGFTFYDLIFPLFLFMVGTSLPFAVSRRMEKGADKQHLFLHILRRTATLFLLGMIQNGLLRLDFENMRWLGVLQRIALGYFFASCLVLTLKIRGQAIVLAVILLGYWALMELVPVPGYGAGVLTPEGNLAAFIDQKFLPGSFCCYTFGDNEGIVSTLPAIGSALLGVLAGHWLRSSHEGLKKGIGLLLAGIVSLGVALVWNPFFPINKLIWTSSYVLFAGGWSLLLLGTFYLIIDVWGWRRWAFPFVVIGMNAITIYFGQKLIDFHYTADFLFGGLASLLGSFEGVLLAFGVLAVKWLFLYFLYRRGISPCLLSGMIGAP